jgi:hypothetical protein
MVLKDNIKTPNTKDSYWNRIIQPEMQNRLNEILNISEINPFSLNFPVNKISNMLYKGISNLNEQLIPKAVGGTDFTPINTKYNTLYSGIDNQNVPT